MTQILNHATAATSSDIRALLEYCKRVVLDTVGTIDVWRDGYDVTDELITHCIGIEAFEQESIAISLGYWLSMAQAFLGGADSRTLFRHNPSGKVASGRHWLMLDDTFWGRPENHKPSWHQTWARLA